MSDFLTTLVLVLAAVVQIFAILVGAWWAYTRYRKHRLHLPNIEFELNCNTFGPVARSEEENRYIAEFLITIRNKGVVQEEFEKIYLKVRGIPEGTVLKPMKKPDDKQREPNGEEIETIFWKLYKKIYRVLRNELIEVRDEVRDNLKNLQTNLNGILKGEDPKLIEKRKSEESKEKKDKEDKEDRESYIERLCFPAVLWQGEKKKDEDEVKARMVNIIPKKYKPYYVEPACEEIIRYITTVPTEWRYMLAHIRYEYRHTKSLGGVGRKQEKTRTAERVWELPISSSSKCPYYPGEDEAK